MAIAFNLHEKSSHQGVNPRMAVAKFGSPVRLASLEKADQTPTDSAGTV